MESWSYIPEEKNHLFCDEMEFSLDAFMRSKESLLELEDNSSCNFERDGYHSEREVVKSTDFVELGFSEFLHKSSLSSKPTETSWTVHDSVLISNSELDSNNSSKKGNSSIHVIAFDSSHGEQDSESKHLCSFIESKTRDSSFIDLKLGRLADSQSAKEFSSSHIHQTALAKRTRCSSLPSQAPVCQVFGCNMDLSSSKDYHKRHKVCDVHSKTAKVVVNGIEQRFCQQCSRFHLVAEFDDGKRSCRRRLAGHNERRRKPQFDYITSKQHKLLHSYQGAKYLGSSLQNIPHYSFQDIFQSEILFSEEHEKISQSGHIKLEEDQLCSPQLEAPVTLGHELSSRALSLLSAQLQSPLHHAAQNSLAPSHTFRSICTQDSDDQVSETQCGINSKENLKSEHGETVDLFQLSSHLQRVEQQRNSVLVKWENDDCSIPTL